MGSLDLCPEYPLSRLMCGRTAYISSTIRGKIPTPLSAFTDRQQSSHMQRVNPQEPLEYRDQTQRLGDNSLPELHDAPPIREMVLPPVPDNSVAINHEPAPIAHDSRDKTI